MYPRGEPIKPSQAVPNSPTVQLAEMDTAYCEAYHKSINHEVNDCFLLLTHVVASRAMLQVSGVLFLAAEMAARILSASWRCSSHDTDPLIRQRSIVQKQNSSSSSPLVVAETTKHRRLKGNEKVLPRHGSVVRNSPTDPPQVTATQRQLAKPSKQEPSPQQRMLHR